MSRIHLMNRADFIRRMGLGALSAYFLPQIIGSRHLFAQSISPLKVVANFHVMHGGGFARELPVLKNPASSLRYERELGVPRFPQNSIALTAQHSIRSDTLSDYLVAGPSGGMVLNDVFDRRWNDEGLIPYLNIITGSDIHWYYGHGFAPFGNSETIHNSNPPTYGATFDQVLKQSPLYSPRSNGALLNPLWTAFGENVDGKAMSRALTDPDNVASSVVSVPSDLSLITSYQQLIGQASSLRADPALQSLDVVLGDFARLQASGVLSNEERQALELQADRLLSLREAGRSNLCSFGGGIPALPSFDPNQFYSSYSYKLSVAQQLAQYVCLSAAACDRSVFLNATAGDFAASFNQFGQFHEEVMHFCTPNPSPSRPFPDIDERTTKMRDAMLPWYASQFNGVIFEMAKAMKDTPSGSGNLLDDSLITIFFESGVRTHEPRGITVVTIGKARNRLRTNRFIDLRGRTATITYNGDHVITDPFSTPEQRFVGLPHVNLMNTLCVAAGLSSNRYELAANQGFMNYRDPNHSVPSGMTIGALLNS